MEESRGDPSATELLPKQAHPQQYIAHTTISSIEVDYQHTLRYQVYMMRYKRYNSCILYYSFGELRNEQKRKERRIDMPKKEERERGRGVKVDGPMIFFFFLFFKKRS